jgi:hypothetical protein
MRKVRRSLVAVVAFVAIAVPSLAGAAGTTTIPTRNLTAKGGTVKWAATVHNAKTCTWSSSPKVVAFGATVKCKSGVVTHSFKFEANTSTKAKDYMLSLTVRGTITTVDHLKVVEAGKITPPATTTTTTQPPATTTTTTQPPATTTTTTQPPPPSTCTVPSCTLTFHEPDTYDATSLAIGGVQQNVPCPDPGVCDQPAGDQIDAVALGMTTGATGMSDPGLEVDNFALALAGGGQGTLDSITFDSSVPYAMGALGPVAPNSSFGADIYFDVPVGSNWSSVNFELDFTNVYAFLP